MYRSTLRVGLAGLAGVLGLALVSGVGADTKAEKGFTPLFNGKDLSGLSIVPSTAKDTFTVKDGVIQVSGKPNGYFYTDKKYKNYILKFQWRYPDKAGNSGCLVHISGPQKVWPKCVEVQGQYTDHGKIFAIGGAKGKFTFDKDAHKKALKPHQEWQSTEIISKDGELTSKINGTVVSMGKSELTEGEIGFQSEGVPIEFKNIRIKVTD